MPRPKKPRVPPKPVEVYGPPDPPKPGRPQVPIDWAEFDKLCHLQATLTEIAWWFRCSEDTIQRAVQREKGTDFAVYFHQMAAGGRISLRRLQFEAAQEGNVTMQIWLGKQYLGQKDKFDVDTTVREHFIVETSKGERTLMGIGAPPKEMDAIDVN